MLLDRFFSLMILCGLPQPVLFLAVVDEGAVPAMGAADGGDDLLVLGGDEALAVAHLEILGAAESVMSSWRMLCSMRPIFVILPNFFITFLTILL